MCRPMPTRGKSDIYPHQRYHQVLNTTLLTIAVEQMPDYLWMKTGQPTHGEGESPSYWYDVGIEQKWGGMEILHTTGIHKQVGDPKKVRKKGSTFCPQKKVRSEGSPFSPPFFQSWKKQAIPKWLLAGTKRTYNVLAKKWRKKRWAVTTCRPKAVILLVNTQIHKFTKDHCGTVPIRWCLLCICCFLVFLLAHGPHKCANAQMHK